MANTDQSGTSNLPTYAGPVTIYGTIFTSAFMTLQQSGVLPTIFSDPDVIGVTTSVLSIAGALTGILISRAMRKIN